MKKLIIFIATFLFAFDTTQILSSSQNIAVIDKNIQIGMTGYVIKNEMMIAKAISLGNNKAKYLPLVKLQNKALATPKVFPKKGDKIIFGLYNSKRLIISPNQSLYLKIKQKYPNINFVSSDIFATYIDTTPKKEDFREFCRDFNVGIIDFVLDKEYLVDCESFYILKSNPIQKTTYKNAFFTNYDKLKASLFSSIPQNWINYYKSLLKG